MIMIHKLSGPGKTTKSTSSMYMLKWNSLDKLLLESDVSEAMDQDAKSPSCAMVLKIS